MFPDDDDDDKKTRKERDEERARKRVLTSSLLHDLRGDMITISQFVIAVFKELLLNYTSLSLGSTTFCD